VAALGEEIEELLSDLVTGHILIVAQGFRAPSGRGLQKAERAEPVRLRPFGIRMQA
jgi:hypothetical protein